MALPYQSLRNSDKNELHIGGCILGAGGVDFGIVHVDKG